MTEEKKSTNGKYAIFRAVGGIYLELIAFLKVEREFRSKRTRLPLDSLGSPTHPRVLPSNFARPNNPALSAICAADDDGGYDSSLSLIAGPSAKRPADRTVNGGVSDVTGRAVKLVEL